MLSPRLKLALGLLASSVAAVLVGGNHWGP
jgi:hypothetical protein